jgi:hypothetical protein
MLTRCDALLYVKRERILTNSCNYMENKCYCFLKRLGTHIDIFHPRKGGKEKGVTAHRFLEKHNQKRRGGEQ